MKDCLSIGIEETNDDLIKEALEFVLLKPEEYLNREVDKTLSGGERKRIELVSVFALKPQLATLDERDSGIDILALDHIICLVEELRSN